jgi:hypothetical protein
MLLAERFAVASGSQPLNDLAARDRAELDRLLSRVEEFDELPGRWQAALLSAETQRGSSSGHRPCCAK